MTDLVLGVDIGGTNTVLGLVDRAGSLQRRATLPTCGQEPVTAFFPRLFAVVEDLLAAVPGAELRAVGIGAPNANARNCTIEDPPNLAWGRVELRATLAAWRPLPLAVDNDANAAAWGELQYGGGRGLHDLLAITLGTGLGSGLVVDGRLVRGATGFAGEIGHVVVDWAGRSCGCGRRGCLETYASATGLVRTVREWLAERDQPSALRDLDGADLTAKNIHAAALAGDALAREAFGFTGELLGRKLTDSVAHTSPEAIFLLGGLAEAGELLFAPVRRALETNLFPQFRGSVQVLPSQLGGDAAVLGSAALAWEALDQARSAADPARPSATSPKRVG